MTRESRTRWRRLVTLAVIVGLSVLVYKAGFRVGREAGIRDITVDSIAESLRARFRVDRDQAGEEPTSDEVDPFATTASPSIDDPFGPPGMEDPFGPLGMEDPFGPTEMEDPFTEPSHRVLADGGEKPDSSE